MYITNSTQYTREIVSLPDTKNTQYSCNTNGTLIFSNNITTQNNITNGIGLERNNNTSSTKQVPDDETIDSIINECDKNLK